MTVCINYERLVPPKTNFDLTVIRVEKLLNEGKKIDEYCERNIVDTLFDLDKLPKQLCVNYTCSSVSIAIMFSHMTNYLPV
jgi:hypothetical protein